MPTTIDDVIEMWERDAKVDDTEPGKEILRIPILHSRYTKILTEQNLLSKKCLFDFHRMKKIKTEYYLGRLDDEELKKRGWEPFRFLLKSDVTTYLESDEDLQMILMKKAKHDAIADYCISVVKELNARTYQLRAYMDWEKFIQGQR